MNGLAPKYLLFPPGYKHTAAPLGYNPWNNSKIAASPARVKVGAIQVFNVGSAPADLSTFILNAPNGQSYTFQFAYAGSIPTTGITVRLPNSGASTAAQVLTAIAGVLALAGGQNVGGAFQAFPWAYATTGATQFQVQWQMAGVTKAATGTTFGVAITAGAVTAWTFGFQTIVPGNAGPVFSWMHG
jgi:hypothetical protein